MSICCISRKYYYDYLKLCRLCNTTAPFYSTAAPTNQFLSKNMEVLQTKVYDIMKWYEQFTGIDEIRAAQNKVIEAQDRFAAAQEKRREITLEVNDLGSKLKDIQEELSGTPRGEEKYITLITKEHKLLKEEVRLTEKLNLYEREERELFTTLTSAVKESHEKERIQANKTKYLSIIGSVVGALIGVTGSTITNRLKLSEIRKMVLESTEDNKKVLLNALQERESSLTTDANSSVDFGKIHTTISNVSESIQKILPELSKIDAIKSSVGRVEKYLKAQLANTPSTISTVDETENSDDKTPVESFIYINDDVKYALLCSVSIYLLYKIFFS